MSGSYWTSCPCAASVSLLVQVQVQTHFPRSWWGKPGPPSTPGSSPGTMSSAAKVYTVSAVTALSLGFFLLCLPQILFPATPLANPLPSGTGSQAFAFPPPDFLLSTSLCPESECLISLSSPLLLQTSWLYALPSFSPSWASSAISNLSVKPDFP